MHLYARPLTLEAFSPYGQVIEAENGVVPERRAWMAQVSNLRAAAQANVTYMSLEPAHYPVRIGVLERHPFSHQMFIPLQDTAHLLLVCPSLPDGTPDLAGLEAFEATGGQSVNYNANVWHAPRTVLFKEGSFVMMRWDAGLPEDTEVHNLPTPVIINPGH